MSIFLYREKFCDLQNRMGIQNLSIKNRHSCKDKRWYYCFSQIQKKYGRLEGDVHYIRLNKGTQGLGISLAGHKDRLQMAVMVAGLNPAGNAYRDGNMQVNSGLRIRSRIWMDRCPFDLLFPDILYELFSNFFALRDCLARWI